MKSLLLATGFPPQTGGIQNVLYGISSHLPPDEIIVLAPDVDAARGVDPCRLQIHLQDFSTQSIWIRAVDRIMNGVSPMLAQVLPYLTLSISLIRQEGIEVIQCGHIRVGFVGYLIKKLLGRPYILYTYAQELLPNRISNWMDRALRKTVFQNADAVVTISEYSKRKVLLWGVNEKRIVKIPLGVNMEKFIPRSLPTEVIERFRLKGRPVVLTVARLVERKGHDMVIRALPKVLEKVANVVYLIVGSGPMDKRLRRLVKALNLEEHVIFAGEVPETVPYYNACDVFIMPSRALEEKGDVEGFGLVYLEANACRKPVIGGRSGGVEDAVLDGVTGLLVDPWSVEEIAEALIRLLTDTEYARKLGENGWRRIKAEMNWQNAAQKVRNVLQQVVRES